MSFVPFLLQLKDISIHFFTHRGIVRAADEINLFVRKGEAVGLVGETGCGKTVTALSVIRLISPPGRIVKGEVVFDGVNFMELDDKAIREVRGRDIAMIFQEPRAALNPVLSVGLQIIEGIQAHRKVSHEEAKRIAVETLRSVGLPDPEEIMKRYPHELSGGMAQRVVIAIAMALRPKLLIADEPTSSLDVTIQAQILQLIKNLRRETGASVLFITHDLGVAAELCDKIAVLYAGHIVEFGSTEEIFLNPRHPYTRSLLRAIPAKGMRKKELYVIEGEIPDMRFPPTGCRFHPRCPFAMSYCHKVEPRFSEVDRDHYVSCHLYLENGLR